MHSYMENCAISRHEIDEKYLLSHKLRRYTGISGPEKSRNNTSEKISSFFFFFFRCVDIANRLLTRHSPLALSHFVLKTSVAAGWEFVQNKFILSVS